MKKPLDAHRLNLHLGANPKIHANARSLRQNLTDAEQVLWKEIRNRKLSGHKFRRQHPILQFVADFYCHEAKLVIEVDGGIHQKESVAERDMGRTIELEDQGIKILRFTNEEILTDINIVLKRIIEELK